MAICQLALYNILPFQLDYATNRPLIPTQACCREIPAPIAVQQVIQNTCAAMTLMKSTNVITWYKLQNPVLYAFDLTIGGLAVKIWSNP